MPKRKDTLAKRMRMALAEQDQPKEDRVVASEAGVPAGWLGAVKTGIIKNNPDPARLAAVARVLGKDISYFTEVLDPPNVPILPDHPVELARLKAAIAGTGWPQDKKDEMFRLADQADEEMRRRRSA